MPTEPIPSIPASQLKVKYFHELKGIGNGNLVWAQRDRGSEYYRVSRFAMNAGRFPPTHPLAPFGSSAADSSGQYGDNERLNNFRNRGYWASCFPEGDGITLHSLNWDKTSAEVVKDIREIFGWEVQIERA